jgi:hypothetical protein
MFCFLVKIHKQYDYVKFRTTDYVRWITKHKERKGGGLFQYIALHARII